MKLYHLVIPLALIAVLFPMLGAKLLAGVFGLAIVLWVLVLLTKPVLSRSAKPRP